MNEEKRGKCDRENVKKPFNRQAITSVRRVKWLKAHFEALELLRSRTTPPCSLLGSNATQPCTGILQCLVHQNTVDRLSTSIRAMSQITHGALLWVSRPKRKSVEL